MDTVQFFDSQSKRVVLIPAAELASGAVCARMAGIEGQVWISSDEIDLKPRPARHPRFSKGVRRFIRQIQAAFAEHFPQTFKQWEDGFLGDQNPAQEIAIWLFAADVYRLFAAKEACPKRRHEMYRCVISCMNSPREYVWKVLEIDSLSHAEAQSLVDYFYLPRK
jgi:hypothetical protein